jgi:hypothetical protein
MSDDWPAQADDAIVESVTPPRRRRIHPIVPTTVSLAVLTGVAAFATFRYNPAATNTAVGAATTTAPIDGSPASTKPVATAAPTTVEPATSTTPAAPATTTTTTVAKAPPPVANGLKPYPAGGLYDGGRPPQFVLVSFDGAADQKILDRWTKAGDSWQARFTYFLSMVYLLSADHKDRYQGPRHGPGESGIGFAPNGSEPASSWISTIVGGLQDVQKKGFEVGMHFGGHWCGPSGINSWNQTDWTAELDAVNAIAANADAWGGLSPARGNVFLTPPTGARTPCLEGRAAEFSPPLKANGYRYDASHTRNLNEWPVFRNDLWNYGFPSVPIRGFPRDIITVDYSINANLVPGGGELSASRATQISKDVYDGYTYGFEQVYYGNRAPYEISNHFTNLGRGAYNDALEKFVSAVCRKPEVHCVTYRELTDWLDLHFAALPSFQAGGFVKLAR